MIDPIIFSTNLLGITLTLRWYGVLAMLGLLVGATLADREIKRRGGDSEKLWDALVWLAVAGVVGARLWYVLNDILSGGTYFVDQPIRAVYITEGGMHIYGAVVAGLITAYFYCKKAGFDFRLLLDSAAPGMLVGQGIGRAANFINQELYGPPTDLPWSVPISAAHRYQPWQDLAQFPEATTRFHPTFFYEALWNFIGAGLLLWLGRRYKKQVKPGVIFALWLIWAGLGRAFLEIFGFRPDQRPIAGFGVSISAVVALSMAVIGALYLLAKYEVIRLPFVSPKPTTYKI
jgi:phosphatidylglycerol:prolipoprotein diacylglycerol transferase